MSNATGAGSLVVSLFMTPLDVVKIRLQAQERFHAKKCFLYSNGLMDHLCPRTNGDPPTRALHTAQVRLQEMNHFRLLRHILYIILQFKMESIYHHQEICDCKWYNRPKYFTGTADALVKISRLEGISSLWSGLSPTLGRYFVKEFSLLISPVSPGHPHHRHLLHDVRAAEGDDQ